MGNDWLQVQLDPEEPWLYVPCTYLASTLPCGSLPQCACCLHRGEVTSPESKSHEERDSVSHVHRLTGPG